MLKQYEQSITNHFLVKILLHTNLILCIQKRIILTDLSVPKHFYKAIIHRYHSDISGCLYG